MPKSEKSSGPPEPFPDPYNAASASGASIDTTPRKVELAPTLIHKSVTRKPVVSDTDSNYIGGIKIHSTGLMDDPVPGSKRGKGEALPYGLA